MGYVHLAIVDIATVLEAIERTQEIMSANQGRCRKMPKSEFNGHMVNTIVAAAQNLSRKGLHLRELWFGRLVLRC
jgi:hypothetical protein